MLTFIANKLGLMGLTLLLSAAQAQISLLGKFHPRPTGATASATERLPDCTPQQNKFAPTDQRLEIGNLRNDDQETAAEKTEPQPNANVAAKDKTTPLAANPAKATAGATPATPGSVPRNHLHWQSLLPGMMK